jgi:hypothetical protein
LEACEVPAAVIAEYVERREHTGYPDDPLAQLSPEEIAALRHYFSAEYAIYERLLQISEEKKPSVSKAND